MSASQTLINLFPYVPGILATAGPLALASAMLAGAASLAAYSRRGRTRALIRAEALSEGLSEPSADFVAQALAGESIETARALIAAPDLMRQRLATDLGTVRRRENAERFAARAALLCDELGLRSPKMPGAPVLFEPIELRVGDEGEDDTHICWVVQIDESNLTLVSNEHCRWPIRTELLARRLGPGGDSFELTLLLNPMPGCHDWVVGHELLDAPHNRRSASRVACSIHAWLLPCTAGSYSLRGRLQVGESIDATALHALPAWERRHAVVVEDLSADGARLRVQTEIAQGDRFYLVLSDGDGEVRGLPLAEVVSARLADDGAHLLGTRFSAVRLKERRCLADFAHRASRSADASPED